MKLSQIWLTGKTSIHLFHFIGDGRDLNTIVYSRPEPQTTIETGTCNCVPSAFPNRVLSSVGALFRPPTNTVNTPTRRAQGSALSVLTAARPLYALCDMRSPAFQRSQEQDRLMVPARHGVYFTIRCDRRECFHVYSWRCSIMCFHAFCFHCETVGDLVFQPDLRKCVSIAMTCGIPMESRWCQTCQTCQQLTLAHFGGADGNLLDIVG